MPFIYLTETLTLDAAARAALPGTFIQLSDGVTHYELGGLEDAATVVLVHGFSVPSYIWDPTFEALTQAGLRVLRYDLFGRGFSDRPRVDYGINLYVRQLSELLEALEIDAPVNLVGLSMGGPVTASFCVEYPERVHRLVLVDPAGGEAITLSPLFKQILLPGLGEWLMGWFGNQALLKSMGSDFYQPQQIDEFLQRYKVQMRYRGFKRSLIRSVRAGMLGDFTDVYRRVGALKRPAMLIWGRYDTTVPLAQSKNILDAMPRTEFHVIEKAGHIPHYERPEAVNPLLLDFIQDARWPLKI